MFLFHPINIQSTTSPVWTIVLRHEFQLFQREIKLFSTRAILSFRRYTHDVNTTKLLMLVSSR